MMSTPVQRFVDDLRYLGDTDREASAVVRVKFGGLVTFDHCISMGGQCPPTWFPNISAPVDESALDLGKLLARL